MEEYIHTVHKQTAEKHKDTHPHFQSNGRFLCCCHRTLQSSIKVEISVSPKMSVNKIEGARQSFGSGASSLWVERSPTTPLDAVKKIYIISVQCLTDTQTLLNYSSYCRPRIEEVCTEAWQLHSAKGGLACSLWTKLLEKIIICRLNKTKTVCLLLK